MSEEKAKILLFLFSTTFEWRQKYFCSKFSFFLAFFEYFSPFLTYWLESSDHFLHFFWATAAIAPNLTEGLLRQSHALYVRSEQHYTSSFKKASKAFVTALSVMNGLPLRQPLFYILFNHPVPEDWELPHSFRCESFLPKWDTQLRSWYHLNVQTIPIAEFRSAAGRSSSSDGSFWRCAVRATCSWYSSRSCTFWACAFMCRRRWTIWPKRSTTSRRACTISRTRRRPARRSSERWPTTSNSTRKLSSNCASTFPSNIARRAPALTWLSTFPRQFGGHFWRDDERHDLLSDDHQRRRIGPVHFRIRPDAGHQRPE